MDPLLLLRKYLRKDETRDDTNVVTLHDQSGNIVEELLQSVYIKLGPYIFPRDTFTNFRSKRGAGEFYSLDAVWFMVTRREHAYGDYMQEARKNSVAIVSLVDRKDLLEYVTECEESSFVDLTSALPIPRRSFNVELEGEENVSYEEEMKSLQKEGNDQSNDGELNNNELLPIEKSMTSGEKRLKIETRPCASRDSVFASGKDFTFVLDLAKDLYKSLSEHQQPDTSKEQKQIPPAKTTSDIRGQKTVSLIEQIAHANVPTSNINSPKPKGITFTPIIIIPASPTANMTMYNVQQFLEKGTFIPTSEVKAQGREKENAVTIAHKFPDGSLVKLRILDNPQRLSSEEWSSVVAVFVQGTTWQFKGWKWESPFELLQKVKGFHLDFEDSKPDTTISSWNVQKLLVSRNRRNMDSTAVFQFWSTMETILRQKRFMS